ncbi:MAG: vWA domain-containing protein [Chloroflexota bacterium]
MAVKSRMSFVLILIILVVSWVPGEQAQAQGAEIDGQSDIVLIIDHSGSMEENDPQFLRLAAAKLFIDLADPDDRIGVVVMSGAGATRKLSNLSPVGDLKTNKLLKQQVNALRNEPMGEETHMGTAITLAYDLLEAKSGRSNPHQFVVMLSDGLPTGDGQVDLVQGATARFQIRRYWKIFSIALAFKDKEGPAYLQQAIADPTGGEVFIAQNADELLDRYLDVYARAGDNRFVDRVEVSPNMLASLVSVEAAQQPTQMSFVLLRGSVSGRIRGLHAPGGLDVVKPYYQNTVYRSDEPEYELYKVPPGAQVGFIGDWEINVAQQDATPAKIAILSRSGLHIRMPSPTPLWPESDSSLRYSPVGRPLLVTVGAKDVQNRWVTQMTPVARSSETDWVALTDNGRHYDGASNDGHYTGLLPAFMEEGDYTVQVEMPGKRDAPIHIRNDYTIRVTSLPTMTLTLPESASTLPLDKPFTGLIDIQSWADFDIEDITFKTAFVERPDGVLDTLAIKPSDDGRFQFEYVPQFGGSYRIGIAAEVQGTGPMGIVRYVDYTEATASVPEEGPTVLIQTGFNNPLAYTNKGALHIPLNIGSWSNKREHLNIQVEGIPEAQVVPNELPLEPNEVVRRTVTIHLPEDFRPSEGQLQLIFTAPEQRFAIEGSVMNVPFVASANALIPILIGVGVVVAIGVFVFMRRKGKKRFTATPATLRRAT